MAMTYVREWWPLISDQDRAELMDRVDSAKTGPLPTPLADHVLRAGADLIAVDGMELDTDSPWVLSDADTDWILANGGGAEAGPSTTPDGSTTPS